MITRDFIKIVIPRIIQILLTLETVTEYVLSAGSNQTILQRKCLNIEHKLGFQNYFGIKV